MFVLLEGVPAMHAFINAEKLPAIIAFAAYFKMVFERFGAKTLSVAISMPMVPFFNKNIEIK